MWFSLGDWKGLCGSVLETWFSPRDLVQSWSSGLEDLDTSG